MIPDHVEEHGGVHEVSYRVCQFLVYPSLRFAVGMRDRPWYRNVVGPGRMGDALDEALADIPGDEPRSISVLRAQILAAAASRVAAGNGAAFTTELADLYEATAEFPTGAAVDDVYDWMGVVTFGDLADGAGAGSVAAALEMCVEERFGAGVLEPGGAMERLSTVISLSVDAKDAPLLATLDARALAIELTSSLTQTLPLPPSLVDAGGSSNGALLALRRTLAAAISGCVGAITVYNVNVVASHFDPLK